MKKRMAVILAAGKGTRMKSNLYKVLHPICGLTMVEHVIRAVQTSGVERIVSIVGHGAEDVKEVLGNQSEYALQEEQLGTGHAVLQAKALLENENGSTLVICGDTPLLSSDTLTALFEQHESNDSQVTILTAIAEDPTGYGRVVRSTDGLVAKNVEHKDASEEELMIKEINTGTYVFDNQALFKALSKVTNDNAQGEYYLPDAIEIIKNAGGKVDAHIMSDMNEAIGVNDRAALSEATDLMIKRINHQHMKNGVTMIQPSTIYIEADVQIDSDTVLESGVQLKGNTRIGSQCTIGSNSEVIDSHIDNNVILKQSVIEESKVQSGATVGPFAHIRPNSMIGKEAHIGNFVEVKNSSVGDKTRAGHLIYIGDSDVGVNVNIGCGTIFVNYDGKYKYRSTVGDDSFIGCNSNLVAPVNVGDRAFIAAGTTVTRDVEDEALAVSRVDQVNIPGYWSKLQSK